MRAYLSVVYEPSERDALNDHLELLPESDRVYALKPNRARGLNSAGFRGREFSTEKSLELFRIVMLGDSVIFGTGVAPNETVPYYLEQLLSSDQDVNSYEVYNLGVGGYNTKQELATLREVGLKYQPDLVILNICLNDSDPVKEVWKAGLVQRARITSIRDINMRTLLGASYFLTFVKHKTVSAIRKYRPDALVKLNSPVLLLNKRVTESAWSGMKEDMLAVSRESLEKGVQFVAVIYPYKSQIALDRQELVPQNDLITFFEQHNIKAFDATDLYKSPELDMFSDGVLHLSAYGGKSVATGILEYLIDREMIPSTHSSSEIVGSRQDVLETSKSE